MTRCFVWLPKLTFYEIITIKANKGEIMNQNICLDIINICLSLEKYAAVLYGEFADIQEAEGNNELQKFWKEMSFEEFEHLKYWTQLIELAEEDKILNIFENPIQVKEELENIKKEIFELIEKSYKENNFDTNTCFSLAYRMEICMLHSTFSNIFHFIKITSEKTSPEDTYKAHIDKFNKALNKYTEKTPELEQAKKTVMQLLEKAQKLRKS